jgi:hypothetical protein
MSTVSINKLEQQNKPKVFFVSYMDIAFPSGNESKSVPVITQSNLVLPDNDSIDVAIDTYFDHYQSLKYKIMYQKKQDAKYYVVDIIVKFGAELIKERATLKKINIGELKLQ